jgi:hypothetical protein
MSSAQVRRSARTGRMCEVRHGNLGRCPATSDTRCEMSFPASNSVVLKQVLDRAQIATVSGLLGVTVASYLEAVEHPADPSEADAFSSLSSTHRAAVHAEQNFVWCLERFGAEREVMETAAVAHECARRLDEAYRELEQARRRPGRWGGVLRRGRHATAGTRAARARDYAHAAMAYSEQVEHLRELLAA